MVHTFFSPRILSKTTVFTRLRSAVVRPWWGRRPTPKSTVLLKKKHILPTQLFYAHEQPNIHHLKQISTKVRISYIHMSNVARPRCNIVATCYRDMPCPRPPLCWTVFDLPFQHERHSSYSYCTGFFKKGHRPNSFNIHEKPPDTLYQCCWPWKNILWLRIDFAGNFEAICGIH